MRTILCIDDHKATLATLALILRNEGYRCLTAENYEEANRRFAGDPVDLVIVDHGLPNVTGDKLAAHLKSIRPVQVLMLTGNADVEPSAAVDLVLIKPQQPNALLASIAQLIGADRVAD